MKRSEVHLLCTGMIDKSAINLDKPGQVIIDAFPFIRTDPVEDDSLKGVVQQIAGIPAVVIFTSRNAVHRVIELLDGAQPLWTIFCIARGTGKLIRACFRNSYIKGLAANASLLSDVVIDNKVSECIFFCGDQRLDELPGKLKEQNIKVQEVIVYKTVLTPVKLERNYDGILFFSPSAVESFLSVNPVAKDTVYFALGDTTARSLRRYVTNEIVVSTTAQKSKLLEEAIAYFKKN